MRLLIVNPNTSDSVTRLIVAEAERACAPTTEILSDTAHFGVAYIETRAEALVGGYASMERAAEHHGNYDAMVVAAFGDPGLFALREMLDVPVVGLTEAALVTAAQHGGRFSIIAISQRIQAWYRECVAAHGLDSRLASIRALDEPLADIGRVQESQGERLVALAEAAVPEDGADSLILAGAPLAGLAREVGEHLPVPAFDGVSCAVIQAEALARLAVPPRRAGSYAAPPTKPVMGLSPALSRLIGR